MQFMLLFKTQAPADPHAAACKQNLPEMAQFIGDMTRAGTIAWTLGLQPPANGARVAYAGGKLSVTDGPFAEAKEMIAGACVVNVQSKAEAIELAKRFISIAGEGESQIFEIIEQPA